MDALEQLLKSSETGEIVNDEINNIFVEFQKLLDDKELAKLEVPIATELTMAKLQMLIDLATLKYDGEIVINEPFEKLEPDGEPYPSKIDSWARGTVSTRKVVAEESKFGRQNVPNSARSNTPSVSSFRSSATGRSKATSRSHRSVGSRATDKGDLDKTGQIIELDDPDSEFGNNLNATDYMFDLLQKSKKKKALGGYYQDDTEEAKGEFDLLQEQMTKAAKDMRGKKFILDRYGNPVVIGTANGSTLPSLSASLNLNVKSEDNNQATSANGRPRTGSQTEETQKEKKKKPIIRVAGSRGLDESAFQPTLSLATTLANVDTIQKVNPGVTVKSKTSTKQGETIQEDAQHISRKTYLQKTSAMLSQGSVGSASRTLQEGSVTGGTQYQPSSPGSYSDELQIGFGESSPMSKIDSVAEIDPMEGGRRVMFRDQPTDLTDQELGLGVKDNSIHDSPKHKLPKKPSLKQEANIKMLRGSPENGKPKDRDVPKNIHPVAARKHLPAPPLGYTTGHGLSLEKYLEKSSLMSGSIDSGGSDSEWHQQWRN